jgi:hypothetical protein
MRNYTKSELQSMVGRSAKCARKAMSGTATSDEPRLLEDVRAAQKAQQGPGWTGTFDHEFGVV